MKRLVPFAVALLVAACAVGPDTLDDFEETDEQELEQGCDALLDLGARLLAIGNIQGTTRYVLDTSEGRCVAEQEELVESLRRHEHGALVDQLSTVIRDPARADPNPHPDVPSNIDPHGDLTADPNPHPDTNVDADSGEDEEVAIVIVWVVVVEEDSEDMAASWQSH